jgi:AraC-like DNA-binding protein
VSTLVLGPGRVVYLGASFSAEAHAHHAVQLVVTDGAPFTWSAEGETRTASIALIPAGVTHALDASGTRVVVILVERHGADGAGLDALAARAQGDGEGLGASVREAVLGEAFPAESAPTAAWLAFVDRCIVHLLGPRSREPVLSRESRVALHSMQRAIGEGRAPRLTEVADEVGLSPTRLTHRFTREVGIPFRALVPWLRVAAAVRTMQAARARGVEGSLTHAAHAAGFADAAHLTRTFRALFGLPPSLVLSRARLVGFG